jgi:hypothetical protein
VIVPELAVLELLTVNVSLLVVAVLVGLNEAVTPEGRLLAVRLTVPLNPFRSLIVIVLLPDAPLATLRLAGEAEMV